MNNFTKSTLLKIFFAFCVALTTTSCILPEGGEDSGLRKIVINEINTEAKYIELYNTSNYSVDVSGWTIHKNNEGAIADRDGFAGFAFAKGTVIPARGYALLNCKGANNEHTGVSLGTSASGISGKKSLLLVLVDDKGNRIDHFVNTANENPAAVDAWDGAVEHTFEVASRVPNGGEWCVVEVATPAEANNFDVIAEFKNTDVDFDKEPEEEGSGEGGDDNGNEGGNEDGDDSLWVGRVVINEVNTDAKYIELFNASTEDVNLGGWTIHKNNEGAISDKEGLGAFAIASGTILPAKGYALLNCKGTDNAHNGVALGTSNSGVSGKKSLLLELIDAEGNRVDYFVNSGNPAPAAVDAWDGAVEYTFDVAARMPNGGDWWVVDTATPAEQNKGNMMSQFFNVNVDFDKDVEEPETPENPDVPTSSLAESVKYVWDENTLPCITLKVSKDEWNRMLQTYDQNSKTKAYFKGDVTFDNGTKTFNINDAGWRLRGNTSRRRPEGNGGEMHNSKNPDWHHFHIQLNLRKYVKDDAHTIGGVRKMYLKWHKDDPMYVREMYCYDLFRRYGVWTAINDIYCRLWIQVEGDSKPAYFGVYEMQETVDDEYLETRAHLFGNDKGNLWKCSYTGDGRATLKYDTDANNSKLFGLDQDTDEEWTYELKTDNFSFSSAKSQLIDFMKKLSTLRGTELHDWLGEVIDIPLFLKTYAVNATVGMWDDYWNNGNNYYMYFTGGGTSGYKFYFIPYDYDNTLGTSQSCVSLSDSGRDTPLKWGSNTKHPLVNAIISFDDYKALYVGYLKELVDSSTGYFDYATSVSRIRAWQDKIRDYVPNDTGEDMSIYDQPASWGNHPEYRLLENSSNNFFKVKAESYKTHLK
ncbi:MAG: CotH kinase family protein [Tidjanibacter sp.]|nr:CotH kinase family protein [Tidjanibacter sp.]